MAILLHIYIHLILCIGKTTDVTNFDLWKYTFFQHCRKI